MLDDLLDDLQDDLAAVAKIRIIPLEFANQDGNSWYLEGDVMVKEAECVALVLTKPEEIKFKKWTKAGHLRLFYIKAHVHGKLINRVLIDGGVVLNVMPYSTVKKLGKSHKHLKEANITMSNVTAGNTLALGFFIAELTVGSRTTNTVLFVLDAKPGYTVLLGREWVHTNQCMSFILHQ